MTSYDPFGKEPQQRPDAEDTETIGGFSSHDPAKPTRRGGPVVVAALLAGVLGGVGGAAGYAAIDGAGTGGDTASQSAGGGSSAGDVSTAESLDNQSANTRTALSGSVQDVAASVLPSVVKIDVRTSQGAGSGSGIILSSDGQILTNNHVVEAAANGELTVAFNDGSTAPAKVVGTDPLTDLAVIQADGVSGLAPATLGSSDDLVVGQQVVAIGSPFGLESTVTSGIVSALDRPVAAGDSQGGAGSVFPAIQTDAAINPGNSGGALVTSDGKVVGINSAIRTDSSSMASTGGSIGLGFAIPIDEARPVVAQLSQGEAATHARIGVSVSDAVDDNGVVNGAGVQDVTAGSAGEEAGLERGDIIVKVDDDLISGSDDLVATIRSHRP
ncbi:MAG: trypsin-like peptidase domain-containing protein, partial [Nocardioidaceae bacterium]|nr:trypsin-like peptidase domain-containing protein [Nocardioidaceae bacterium]